MNTRRITIRAILVYLEKQSPLFQYGLAVVAVLIAGIVARLIPAIGHQAMFLPFFFVIIESAFWLGHKPTLLAMTLSSIAVNTLLLLPTWHSAPYDAYILNVGFWTLSIVIVITTAQYRLINTKLRENQQDLSFAQSIGNIGSWRMDVKRNILSWSDENHRIFGVSKGKSMSYETFLSSVHSDDREYVDQQWQAALSGQPYDIEHRIVVAGQVKWVRERAVLEFSKKGNLLGAFGTTQDITERKSSELELQESQQRYANIIESAMDAIITIDIHSQILVFNVAAEKLFGCQASEAIGSSLDRFIPTRFRDAHAGHVRGFARTNISSRKMGFLGAIKGLHANGTEFPIEVSIAQNGSGDDKSFTAILRDITERQRGEVALQAQFKLQDQLSKVAASVPGMICSFRVRPDGSSHLPYASSAVEPILGFSADALNEDFSPVFARIHPDDIDMVNDTTTKSAQTLQAWEGAFRYNHPNKGEIWLESNSLPQREDDGSILWHGYIHDVTDRKKSEIELQEHAARYQLVLDGAQDAIWDWDVPNKRVHFSSRWKALRGFADDEVSDHEEEWSANIHPDDKNRVIASVQAHFDKKTPVFSEEYQIRCKDDSWKWILDRGIAQWNSDGHVIRMAGSESDITARKLAEAALRDRESELRLIMDATPALTAYLDTNFRYLRVNKSYENWFCMNRDQILGQKVPDIIGESAWTIVGPNLERARSGERISFDFQIPYGTGRPRWVHGNYIPDKDAKGIVKGIVVHVIDIEDRKQAELEREKFVSLVNSSQEFIGLCDLNFKPFYINDAGMRLVGIDSREQAFQTPVQDFFFPEDQQFIIYEFFPRVLREKSSEVEIRFRHFKTGAAIWMIYNVFYIKNDNGEPVGLATVSRDITESKMAAAAIREIEQRERLSSEKYLHELEEYKIELEMQNAALQQVTFDLKTSQDHFMQLYDFAPVGYLTLAVDGKITEANHTAAKLLGMERDQLINHRFARFIDDDYKERWYAFYLQATRNNAKQAIELPMYGENGVNFFAQLNSQFISANGELPLLRLALVDITERKSAEAALRESETRLSLIVKEVQVGYWDWDLLTSTLYLSNGWKQQIGFDDTELSNHWQVWNNLIHPDDRDFVMAATDNFIAGYQSDFDLQYRLRHKDGSYRWIHTRCALLHDQHHNPVRMLGINLDISEFKKATELNRQHDQMEQSFRLYVASQTAAAIAHELNQPLNAISSYSDVALQLLQSGNPNPQKLSDVIEKCGQQAQRAGQVIRQLLALLHKGETISEPIDMNSLVHDVRDYIKANIELGSVKIELDLAAELPMVIANQMHIQKVLIGLLRNGLESIEESGTENGMITITTSKCFLDPTMMQVTVRDCGKGVADNYALKTIFQPFYTTKNTGIGMGLAINRALIEVHGGKMWAEQNNGPGITINFTLPFEL